MSATPMFLLMLGHPGSGKSYFARQMAEHLHAVRLNGDAMRIALYGSLEEVLAQPDRGKVNRQTFGAIDYAAMQVLRAGHTVIYDANNDTHAIRAELTELAKEHGVTPIVVWMKTPDAVARRRGQEREAANDQRRFDESTMNHVYGRSLAHFNEPQSHEQVVVIDGTIPFEDQLASFNDQVNAFHV